ncbi:hypothetical protein [Peribacillus muralis]|uniref:hypothetical protein n=1 Tax=Peribacillus muralis TaxID=264697 RepID=UPI00366B9BE6
MGNRCSIFVFTLSGMKRKATRLLREMRVYVRPRRLKAEEAHGPPAESECLQCNGTTKLNSPKLSSIKIPSSCSLRL